jgi:hypothetical protein
MRLMGGLCLGLGLLYLASAVTHFALKRWPPGEEEWKDVAGESMALGAGIFATVAVMALGAAAGVAEVGPAWRYERSVRPLVLGEKTSLCAGLACSGRRAFSFRVPPSGEVSLVAVAFDGCSTDLYGVDGEPLRSEEGEPLSLEKLSFTTPHHGLILVDQPGRELAIALDACSWHLTVSEAEP